MYRTTTNFESQPFFEKLSPKSHSNPIFNPESFSPYPNPMSSPMPDIKDMALKHTVEKLIKQNQILHDNYNKEREKNYELLELKRRLEEDIERLEFQLERIGTYQNLNIKEGEIKRNQVMQENFKMKNQLDGYFEENKSMRADIRKWMDECEALTREKEDLVNQNVILLNQLADLKGKIAQKDLQINQLESQMKRQAKSSQRQPSIHEIVTLRSINQKSNPNLYQSPPQSPNSEAHYGRNAKYLYRHESTNPSEQKISLSSPTLNHENRIGSAKIEKIYEDFYEDNVQPSPRSFNNQFINQKLQFLSPMRDQINSVGSVPRNQVERKTQKTDIKSPSVFSYANRQSPMIMEPLKLKTEERSIMLETYQRKELKDEVAGLRNQLVDDLITKHYKNALECAEKEKKNSLKLFIQDLEPKIETLDHMVLNYLEVRSMLAESCPTLRLKWEPVNPLSNASLLQLSTSDPSTKSQLVLRNTVNLSKIYESIKEKSRTEKTVTGQYLALFRLLTLLNKIEQEIDPLLVDCIKHSALKQIHRIKACKEGKPFSLQE